MKQFDMPEMMVIRFEQSDIVTSSSCPNDCPTCPTECEVVSPAQADPSAPVNVE